MTQLLFEGVALTWPRALLPDIPGVDGCPRAVRGGCARGPWVPGAIELPVTGLRPEREAGSAYGAAPGMRPAPPGRLAKSLALTGAGLTAAGAATALGRGFRRAK